MIGAARIAHQHATAWRNLMCLGHESVIGVAWMPLGADQVGVGRYPLGHERVIEVAWIALQYAEVSCNLMCSGHASVIWVAWMVRQWTRCSPAGVSVVTEGVMGVVTEKE